MKEGAGEERREEARRDAWNALVVPFCTYMHYYTVLAHDVHLWRWDRLADARPRGGAAAGELAAGGEAPGVEGDPFLGLGLLSEKVEGGKNKR